MFWTADFLATNLVWQCMFISWSVLWKGCFAVFKVKVKSGSNIVHSHPSHILCLTPCVKAKKSFHGVLPCLVLMYHQTNLDCKSFSISEDLVETIVALTLNIANCYFWILWLMMMHHHTKFDRSEILTRKTFTQVQNLHCDLDLEYSKATFSQDTPAYEHALSN